ncbi:MAG: bifunctional (p)ppGpp synthetase/guanosine-3',5'-bis(diphosphate) 3'-pyrophosphohydrolase [Spirochaetales bacterium]|nr:bifunctional (p)ppGpp synthetase/guanosine-3',5'-bis(diphosphate) 3'-pyrophosphohydrolase [Spirochaetales bacterium]
MNNADIVFKALHLAAIQHSRQKRKADDSPYINHITEILHLLTAIGSIDDPEILAAAALHDVLEDTDLSSEIIQKQFGNKILSIVLELTDDKTKTLEERRNYIIDTIAGKSKEAQKIKIADFISNVRTLPPDWSKEKIQGYIDWIDMAARQCKDINLPLEEMLRTLLKEQRKKFF